MESRNRRKWISTDFWETESICDMTEQDRSCDLKGLQGWHQWEACWLVPQPLRGSDTELKVIAKSGAKGQAWKWPVENSPASALPLSVNWIQPLTSITISHRLKTRELLSEVMGDNWMEGMCWGTSIGKYVWSGKQKVRWRTRQKQSKSSNKQNLLQPLPFED